MKFSPRSLPFALQLESLFFISGFSALVLEVIYARLLRYGTGTTASAVAAVLCAYMLGLGASGVAFGASSPRLCRGEMFSSPFCRPPLAVATHLS